MQLQTQLPHSVAAAKSVQDSYDMERLKSLSLQDYEDFTRFGSITPFLQIGSMGLRQRKEGQRKQPPIHSVQLFIRRRKKFVAFLLDRRSVMIGSNRLAHIFQQTLVQASGVDTGL